MRTAALGFESIDAQTGALLRAIVNYNSEIKDSNGTLWGSEAGLLEISVSQVHTVTVKLP